MVYQHGSPFYDEDEESCKVMHRKASHSFPISRVYQAHIPTLFFGILAFWFCFQEIPSTGTSGCQKMEGNVTLKPWYYTTNLHKGAFMLPRYVEDMLEEEEDRKNRAF